MPFATVLVRARLRAVIESSMHTLNVEGARRPIFSQRALPLEK